MDSHGNQRWIVEEILDDRTRSGNVEYFVKWSGYPDPTWEPSSVLEEDIPDLIRHYKANNP